ncbi:MAG: hypothetical protein A3F74_02060 [Betaproteobacteria bacterium RIFCSPLOWO2_12_FULL_62_58]|nr:MAG: hypothetical protein A3F74_02060 [Betaproteobacteria bacterium RIFCSPLOWO2_12_FULL_62_58]
MSSYGLKDAPAYKTTAPFKKRLVDSRETLKADAKPSELMQPSNSAFHHPAGFAAGEDPRKRDALRLSEQVVLAARTAAIGCALPVNIRWSHSGLRPAYRSRRRFFGDSGSISAHNSSSISGSGIVRPPGYAMYYRTDPSKKQKRDFIKDF